MKQGLQKGMSLLMGAMIATASALPSLAWAQAADDNAPSAPVALNEDVQNEATPGLQSNQAVATQGNETAVKVGEEPPKATSSPVSPGPVTSSSANMRRKPSTIFAFGFGQIQDLSEYNLYERLYGAKTNMYFLQSGYYFYSNEVDVGFSAKFGYYHDRGHPLTSIQGLEIPVKGNLPDSAVTDPKQSIDLTLIPLQALLELAYSPFPVSRRIVFRGWLGPEFLFVQEALRPNLPDNTTPPEGSSLVSKGWNRGLVTGAMISVSISGIESRSDYALGSMGIDRIYISPFLEIVKTTSDKMGNYDRKIYGINITFEGLR
jgi:hypothetical protein